MREAIIDDEDEHILQQKPVMAIVVIVFEVDLFVVVFYVSVLG